MDINTENKMPTVTVVIPAYNAIRYLAETMDTVLSQTYQDFEVLIVNDGSTDETPNWVNQLSEKEPKVRMISQVNKGLAAARNTGIKESEGEYIAILDADDLWEPTKLQKQVDCLDKNPKAGLCYTWTALADNEGKDTGRVVASHAEGNVWQQLTEINFVCCGSTPMIRRSCFETVGFFAEDLRFSEDWDMWLRIAMKYPFVVVKEPLIRYRQHPNNMSKDCQSMLEGSRILIERNFANAPIELLHYRNRSYGCIYLYLGWRAIENQDYQQAQEFRDQAIAHRPQLRFSAKCIRLTIAILIQRWLGADFYAQVKEFIFSVRRRGIGAVDR
ncbi:MAG: glycosyltransferase family 2 protein [Waterburya sp.]